LPILFNNLQPNSFSKALREWLMAEWVRKSSRAVSVKLLVRAKVTKAFSWRESSGLCLV
jgi:hypothetical protein